ncbi:MAG: hypothetical protein ABJE95_00975 [Byssovorax sp.]
MRAASQTPPPGFDDLTVDEQIDHVQALWERISARADEVPWCIPTVNAEYVARMEGETRVPRRRERAREKLGRAYSKCTTQGAQAAA